jgi:CheY-like chemotaxis protein
MVTAYGREDVMLLAQQAGVDGFLIKPVSPSSLLDTILTVLGRGGLTGRQEKSLSSIYAGAPPDLSGRKILLVEDNAINREFAIELLRTMHIQVEEAVNGEEAVAMVQRRAYDAVLMDIQMPVMDGLEATKRIRALEADRFKELPIIAMTALAMARDAEETQAAGMNDHVTKPVDPEALFACLLKWLPKSETSIAVEQPADTLQALPGNTVYSQELLALEHLQVLEGIKRIGGREEAYRKQLKRFREHYPNAATELERLLQAQQISEAEAYCHSLKGVSGNIGAQALYECISGIDNTLKQQKNPAPESIEQFRELLQKVMSDIDSLASMPASVTMAAEQLSDEVLKVKLGRLMTFLETDYGAAETLLNELRMGVVGSPIEEDVNKIAAQMDIFEIDQALALSQQLLDNYSTNQ